MFIAAKDKRFVAPSGARCNRLRDKLHRAPLERQQFGVRKSYKHPAPLEHPQSAAQNRLLCKAGQLSVVSSPLSDNTQQTSDH
jgi:hypothetical protein